MILNGRGGGIRTRDPLHPMQVRYQAALRPEGDGLYTGAETLGCYPHTSAQRQMMGPHQGMPGVVFVQHQTYGRADRLGQLCGGRLALRELTAVA